MKEKKIANIALQASLQWKTFNVIIDKVIMQYLQFSFLAKYFYFILKIILFIYNSENSSPLNLVLKIL